MTRQEIEAVFERVKTWPEDRQHDAAQVLVRMENIGLDPYELSTDEEAALDEAEAEIERGDVASEDEVQDVLARLRRAR